MVRSLLPIVGEFVALPVMLWALRKGWKQEEINQLENGRLQLRQHVSKLMQPARRYFSEVDLAAKRSSRVDEYFKALMCTLTEQVEQIAQQKLKEVEAEVTRLTNTANLDGEKRQRERQQIQQQVITWNAIGVTIKEAKEAVAELKALEQSI
jgi:hypothetical protein